MKSILVLSLCIFGVACSATSSSSSNPVDALSTAEIGMFIPVGNHQTSGSVQIEELNGNTYVVLQDDFRSQTGPDLRVVLRNSQNNRPMKILAPLQAQSGRQEYPVDINDEDLAEFDQVVIYCAKFHVDFGIARIQ